jgi:hypothetical protein
MLNEEVTLRKLEILCSFVKTADEAHMLHRNNQ